MKLGDLRRQLFEGEVLRLMGITLVTKPIGLAVQMLIAGIFGAGYSYDAYAFSLFLVGLVDTPLACIYDSAIIPLIANLRRELPRDKLLAVQNATLLLFLAPGTLYALLMIFRPEIVIDVIGGRLPPETRAYVLQMVRVMAVPSLVMQAVAMLKSLLNLSRRFRVPAVMPLLNSVTMLVAVLAAYKPLGIWALPLGFVVSYMIQLIATSVFAVGSGTLSPVRPRLPAGMLARIWRQGRLLILSQGMLMVNLSVDRFFAAMLVAGSISAVTYSSTIMNLGCQMIGYSLGVVMFTRMAELFAARDYRVCGDYILVNLSRLMRIIMPVCLALVLSGPEVVRVLFQRGAFDAEAAVRTSGVLAMYLIGMPATLLNLIVARALNAMQKYRDKLWLDGQYMLTNIIGNAILVRYLAVKGLAISSAFAITLHVSLSLLVMHRYRTGMATGAIGRVVFRSYLLAAAAYAVYSLSGFGRFVDSLDLLPTVPGAIGSALLRFAFVAGVYYLMDVGAVLWRRRNRRRRAEVGTS